MGIKGFIPFLLRQCPQVFHKLPERFSELGGKTIAIDGTLITQRFHFADDPHKFRHSLGWYRLINELKSSHVKPICIFDGIERSEAKMKEVTRRKKANELVISRRSLESTRSHRLTTILDLLQQLQHLDSLALGVVWSRFLGEIQQAKNLPHARPPTRTMENGYQGREEDRVVNSLIKLYLEFRSSTSPTNTTTTPGHCETGGSPKQRDMSKGQAILLKEEEKIWEVFSEEISSSDSLSAAMAVTMEVMETSQKLLGSYKRRSVLPTQQIYEDCRRVIRAMGVPVLQAEHAYEGEALAASLCRDRLADAVMSEDTDVLVYEVPLIRSVSNGNGPIALIDGPQIRGSLGLNPSSYIDLALLMGSDFSRRIPFVGPMTAISLIRSHGSIEAILESFKELKHNRYGLKISKEEYIEEIRLGREVFNSLPRITQEMAAIIQYPIEPDQVVLQDILRTFPGWEGQYQYNGDLSIGNQRRDFFKDYFMSSEDGIGKTYV